MDCDFGLWTFFKIEFINFISLPPYVFWAPSYYAKLHLNFFKLRLNFCLPSVLICLILEIDIVSCRDWGIWWRYWICCKWDFWREQSYYRGAAVSNEWLVFPCFRVDLIIWYAIIRPFTHIWLSSIDTEYLNSWTIRGYINQRDGDILGDLLIWTYPG